MKNLMLTLALLMSVICGAMAQNDAMYIYRNDGEFNAFLKADVDSVVYSYYDVDSIYHKDCQMQVVYTPDSIYKIPLAVIDSVSFKAPKIEYQQSVKHFSDDFLDYVIAINDKSITLSSATPEKIVPNIGEVIYCDYSDKFSQGFAGRVEEHTTSAEGIVLECSEVGLRDIFKTLVCVGKSKSKSLQAKSKANSGTHVDASTVYFDFPTEFTVGVSPVSLNIKPILTADYVICIEDGRQTYANYRIDHHYDCSFQLDCKFDKEYKPDPTLIPLPTIPFGTTGFYAQFSLGYFFETSGEIDISGAQRFSITGTSEVTITDDSIYYNPEEWKRTIHDPEFSISGDARVAAGFVGRLTFNWVSDKLASVGATLKVGPEFDINFKLSSDGLVNRSMYSALKDSQLRLNAYFALQAGYRMAGITGSTYKDCFRPIELRANVNSWYLLPEFSGLSWDKEPSSRGGRLFGNIYRTLLMPVQIGWSLYDYNDNMYEYVYFPDNYRKQEDWKWGGIGYQFGDLPWGARYTAYPIIKILGIEMRADQSADINVDPYVLTGEATNVKATTATVSGNAEGLTYAAVVQKGICYTTNQYSTNPDDWTFISAGNNDGSFSVDLKELKQDTHYYYCSFVNLDGEYTYGEVKSFMTEQAIHACPDSNHPHAIDLGLPSGTKWCCMNVGATSPEGYGGYYAWGETEEKSVYGRNTYLYFDKEYGYVNIGSNIAGTSYDVAHVRMGGSWRMPSLEQQVELKNWCTSTWTQQNGVHGMLMTGVNGGQIFLPAAGYRWDSSLKSSIGYYWSSSLYGGQTGGLNFGSSYVYWYGDDRHLGLSVRAVCP